MSGGGRRACPSGMCGRAWARRGRGEDACDVSPRVLGRHGPILDPNYHGWGSRFPHTGHLRRGFCDEFAAAARSTRVRTTSGARRWPTHHQPRRRPRW
jgi:hypothetical protein